MGRPKKTNKEKRLMINFYLEKTLIKRCDEIVNDQDNIFDDRSTLIRYCVRMQLPILEKELKNKTEEE